MTRQTTAFGARAAAAVYGALACRTARYEGEWGVLLSTMQRQLQPSEVARWRGRVDALAVRARFSDPGTHKRRAPMSQPAQSLFSLLEQIRVEVLAARQFKGVRSNLAALAQEQWIRARPDGVVRVVGMAWVESVALLARAALGAPLPPAASESLARSWRTWMTPEQAREIGALGGLVEDQDAYALQSLRVIETVCGEGVATPKRESAGAPSVQSSSQQDSADAGQQRAQAIPLGQGNQRTPAAARDQYRAYATAFDQAVFAEQLCDAATLQHYRRELDLRARRLLNGVMRWAHRLQRCLLAQRRQFCGFDADEGVLDSRRLTRIITRPLDSRLYKRERTVELDDTVVTMLLDNSGSMRGLPVITAAVCAEVLGRTLERCGIGSELLGFTTRGWHGGRARQKWVAAGRPRHPGRLAELQHIIYKGAQEPWRHARMRLGLVLQAGLLKENVDGEALLWAHERLLLRPESRKILLIISDGAPLDEATLEANDPAYLERHLHSVIRGIESMSKVELAAIGVGHDVSGYYRRATTLADVDTLGEAMAMQLVELFERRPHTSAARHPGEHA